MNPRRSWRVGRWVLPLMAVTALAAASTAWGQGFLIVSDEDARLPRPIIIWPPYPPPPPRPPVPPPPPPPPAVTYSVDSLSVQGRIDRQVAQVEVAQTFLNTGSRTLEASFVFPLPYDGAVDRMTFMVDGKEIPSRMLKADEARREYEQIVRRNRDPALLEWVGTGMFKTSVFPIPPGEKRTVSIHYTQLCRKQESMVDFLFPLSAAKYSSKPLRELSVRLSLRSERDIKNVYCPNHDAQVKRLDGNSVTVEYSARDTVPLTDFRIMYDESSDPLAATLLSYKSPDEEDGFFLLLVSPAIPAATQPIPKTVVFVADRSGSMSGKKIEQLREAMKFVIQNLREGDLFNIVAYDSEVELFRPELQRYNDTTRREAIAFAEGLVAGGSTNIDAALSTALSQLQDAERPNYVLFLTDGLPTTGVTNEMRIVENMSKANRVKAQVYTFGVGYDVNSRLLDRVARVGRGYTAYVRPDESIEEHVARLYRRIEAPVLTDVELDWQFDGDSGPPPVYRLNPNPPFDISAGEQLTLTGRYRRSGAAKVVLRGRIGNEQRTFAFPVEFAAKSGDESKAFVARVWAIRRIGDLLDEIDLHGRNNELIEELTQLALKHGIVTPYTSFFADENVPLHDTAANTRRAAERLLELNTAEGAAGFAQRRAKGVLQQADRANLAWDSFSFGSADGTAAPAGPGGSIGGGLGGFPGAPARMPAAAAVPTPAAREMAQAATGQTMRQIGNRTFYRRQGQWIDSSLTEEQQQTPRRIKQFSEEYFELARRYGRRISQYFVFDEPVLLNVDQEAVLIEP